MSAITSAVDGEGKINARLIQRELVSALEEDRTYNVTDEAKKKYITKAASYDEFRHYVATADLKRVSKADMDSLSQTPKGWQQRSALATGGGTKKKRPPAARAKTKTKRGGAGGAAPMGSAFPTAPPTSSMEFERDWRRHASTPEACLRYLTLCGPATFVRVFSTELDVSLLGQVLAALADRAAAAAATATAAANSPLPSAGAAEAAPPSWHDELRVAWSIVRVLPSTGRFALNASFMEDKDRANAAACLDWAQKGVPQLAGEDDAAAAELAAEIAAVRRKFGC